ncbi:MAG: hypothetical protein CBB60_003760 [Armatimonadetes bacterium Cent15-Ar3]|nr:MAG: hypothetical protein CBB60_003760 [Armatimonadetes bacterium Cent15-Ar3]
MRRTLSEIRSALGTDKVRLRSVGNDYLELKLDDSECDVLKFVDLIDHQQWEKAVSLFDGPLTDFSFDPAWQGRRRGLNKRFVDANAAIADTSSADPRALARAFLIEPRRESVEATLRNRAIAAADSLGVLSIDLHSGKISPPEPDAVNQLSPATVLVSTILEFRTEQENLRSKIQAGDLDTLFWTFSFWEIAGDTEFIAAVLAKWQGLSKGSAAYARAALAFSAGDLAGADLFLNLASQIENERPAHRAVIYALRAVVNVALGEGILALELIKAAAQSVPEVPSDRWRGEILQNFAYVLRSLEQFEEACEALDLAEKYYEACADELGLISCLSQRAIIASQGGKSEQALKTLDQVAGRYAAVDNQLGVAWCLTEQAELLRQIGSPLEGIEKLNQALQIRAQRNLDCGWQNQILCRCLIESGQTAEATQLITSLVASAQKLGLDHRVSELNKLMSRIC